MASSGGSREGRGWWIFFGIVTLIGGIVITVVSVTALAVLVGISQASGRWTRTRYSDQR